MSEMPCSKRVFPLRLAAWLPGRYASYLHWLSRLLERLGHDSTLAAWQAVCQDDDDGLLLHILTTGWKDAAQNAAVDIDDVVAELCTRFFPVPVEGVSGERARQLVEQMPPIRQIKQILPSLYTWRETTAYEALHLAFDGPARLAEALIRSHGKQGELIVYDVLREERAQGEAGKTGSVKQFIADLTAEPEEANLFTAGLEVERVPVSECEIELRVKQCEWARYFRERHPQVGYLMACSTDEVAYRAFNAHLRMQRTATLMEGGAACDFRIYARDAQKDGCTEPPADSALALPQATPYADLILQVGLNLQAGQRLFVTGGLFVGVDIRLAPLVEIIVERAYARGARHVDVVWSDPALDLSWLRHASVDSVTSYPGWFAGALLDHLGAGDALLMLYAEDPDLLAGLDAGLVAAAEAARREPALAARAYIHRDAINWTVASAPIPPWSARVLPDVPADRRDLALWDLIRRACRLDQPDPLSAWRAHLDDLAQRAEWLNRRRYASLVYSGPGTRLDIGLPSGHVWQGGRSVSETGIPFVANLPTEEIFTLPHKEWVEGVVRATRPLQYGGQTIEGLTLVFSAGRVVEYSARSGNDALEALIHTDEGAARLGEVALVAHNSPLSQLGVVFYNMLFDENACSHLALGSALRVSLRGAENISDEEFGLRGGNTSRLHCDFAVGAASLDVDGVTQTGETEAVMRGGEWAFSV